MISVTDALARITAAFAPLPAETVGVADCLGRVLAEPLVARTTQPPNNVAAMDGYAVRADDFQRRLPVRLHVIGEVSAGQGFRGSVHPGEAVRISAGATMPGGTNAVAVQDIAQLDADGYITVGEAVPAARHVRPAGLDFTAGQICLPAGKTLTARDVGLIAAMNVPWLRVRRRPRVAILATGDEVVLPGEPLGAHQIVSSNTLALMALVTASGGIPIHLGVALDNAESLLACAAAAEGTDLLVTTGGASIGDHDLVHRVLGRQGSTVDFWRVAMRPGRPLLFGRVGSVPLIGLPGNPVSSLITALLFVRPALRVLLAQPPEAPMTPTARLGLPLPANDDRQAYLRASLSWDAGGELTATPFAQQDSAILSTLAAADCLIIRPPGAGPATTGDRVEILRLDGGYLST